MMTFTNMISTPPDDPQNWRYVADGSRQGWVPMTAQDKAQQTADARAALYPGLGVYEQAIQSYIDATARSKDYADGVALASYVNSTNAVWCAEAKAFVAWRDAVWGFAYRKLAAVGNGTEPQPAMQALLSALPAMVWPA